MNGNKIRAVILAALMVFSVFAVAVPVSAQSGASSDVSITPSSQDVAPGSTVTYDIVVENAPDGVDSYDYTVSTSDASNASIVDFAFAGNPAQSTENYAADNSSVDVVGGLAGVSGGQDVVVGTVTVEGDSDGDTADLDVSVNQLVDGNNNNINVTGVNGASVSVTSGNNNNNNSGTGPDASSSVGNLNGELYWAGQTVSVSGLNPNTDVQLREDEGDDGTSLEDQLTTDANGEVLIDTADLESGDYYLSQAGSQMDANPNNIETFEVSEQSLDIAFDDDSVDKGDTTELDVDTNRGSSDVVVHADGDLDDGELMDIFATDGDLSVRALNGNEASDLDDDYSLDSDEAVVIENLGDLDPDDELGTLNFTDIDASEYEFQFDVSDSDAGDTASLEVTETDVDAEFSEGVVAGTAGDYVQFTVEMEDTSSAYIQFGDESVGYTDILYVEDDDDDDEVSVWVNTRTVGQNADSLDDIYYSPDDIVDSYEYSVGPDNAPSGNFGDVEFLNDDEDALNSNQDATLNDYREALDIEELDRPIQPADYELSINGDDGFIVNDDDASESQDELDSGVLELTAPEIGDITTHVAPSDAADEDNTLEDLSEAVTQREEIALDDRLVIKAEATGIYGALGVISDQTPDELTENGLSGDEFADLVEGESQWNSEDVTFDVEAEEAIGNQDPNQLVLNDLDSDQAHVVVDHDAGAFYVIVDTSDSDTFSRSLSDGDDYTATLEYSTDDDFERSLASPPYENAPTSVENGEAGYPYYEDDTTVDSSAEFTFAERSVSFDNVNVDDMLEAGNTEESAISGTTNVAPGTDSELRVSSTDASSSFRSGEDVNISESGDFSAEFDFSGQEVDDEFDTSFRVGGSSVDDVDSTIVEEGTISEDAPEEDDESEDDESEDGESEDDGESDDGMTDDGETDESADEGSEGDGESSDDTPGFGAIVALVAVLGAALLATRRQN